MEYDDRWEKAREGDEESFRWLFEPWWIGLNGSLEREYLEPLVKGVIE